MADINRITLTGHTTKDVELRQTNNGKSVGSFTLAIQGIDKNDVMFVECTIWGTQAENAARYVGKGSKVAVDGRLEISKYMKDGQNRSSTRIQVSNLAYESLRAPGAQGNNGGYQQNGGYQPQYNNGGYQRGNYGNNGGQYNNGGGYRNNRNNYQNQQNSAPQQANNWNQPEPPRDSASDPIQAGDLYNPTTAPNTDNFPF